MMGISKYDELLVTALESCFNPGTTSALAHLDLSEWEGLIDNAIKHGVAPFLWHRFQSSNFSSELPENIRKRFAKCYLQSAGRGVIIRNQLFEILELLNKNDIPVIVLKGAYFADSIYQDFSIRPMQDIDILIRENDSGRVEKALLSVGYNSLFGVNTPLNRRIHYSYKRPGWGVPIEVHFLLRSSRLNRELDIDQFWSRAVITSVVEHDVSVFSPEDLILYHCFHATKHIFQHFALRSFCDIALIIKHFNEKVDWKIVAERAKELQIANNVYFTLKLVRVLMQIGAPQEFLHNLKPVNYDLELEGLAKTQIFEGMDRHYLKLTNFAKLWHGGSIREKVLILRDSILPLKGFVASKYNLNSKSGLVYFYYLIRLVNFIWYYKRTLWKLVIQDKESDRIIRQISTRIRSKDTLLEWLKHA